jgi:phosphatidylinositol-3-phosphatase
MSRISGLCAGAFLCFAPIVAAADPPPWAANLPQYDHILIVVEENKDHGQIIGNRDAQYINNLASDGASLAHMFGEEHHSEGNYFWLFSGSNQNVGFKDQIPSTKFTTSNLGVQLIHKQLSFKGYSENLPGIGSEIHVASPYARKHVPWVSFDNLPKGTTVETSSNLRFADFPSDFTKLPTVAFVIPNLDNDMHDGSIKAGDEWLKQNIDRYYQWSKMNNSLLIVTFDENSDETEGLTDPGAGSDREQNRIATIFAGAHVKASFPAVKPMTHVNILRTIEAMYGLPKSGAQQPNALKAGISDDATAADVFERVQ